MEACNYCLGDGVLVCEICEANYPDEVNDDCDYCLGTGEALCPGCEGSGKA